MPTARRLRWWTELGLLVAVYVLYSAGRLVARGDVGNAVDHGLAILTLEEMLHLDAERPLNRLFTDAAWLGVPSAYAYAALHYLVTPAVLLWLWRRRPAAYRVMRAWLMTATLLGLVGFTLFPTCPPRLLDPAHGFVDTMAQYGEYGWWGAEASAPEGLGGLTNQYAAMPSLHVGWALWCAVVVWRYAGGSRWIRVAAFAYPLAITLVVMGTANHFFLDAVAGVAVMGAGLLLTRPLLRRLDALRLRSVPARPRGATRAPGAPGSPGSAVVAAGGPARDTHADATRVGAGCQTSARTAHSRATPEARADDDTTRRHAQRADAAAAATPAESPAPAAR